jgi:hypothetical protein
MKGMRGEVDRDVCGASVCWVSVESVWGWRIVVEVWVQGCVSCRFIRYHLFAKITRLAILAF